MLKVVSPFDRSLIKELEYHDWDHVDSLLAQATQLSRDRSAVIPTPRRIEILEKFASLIEAKKEELALQAAREGGKPLIDSRVEVERGISGVKVAIRELMTREGRTVPMGVNESSMHRLAYTIREPIGPVVAVSAFNHPFNLIIHQVIPAVAVGCPVIVKPALTTPLSCLSILELLYEAGLPSEWAQAVITEDSVSEKLVTDSRVAFFSFIGSARVGWMLRSKLAPGTRCALEHGGAAPVVIEPDANLDESYPLLAKGGFYHAGQVCVSVQRIFAHESIFEEVVEGLASVAKQYRVGDPTLETTDVGPLIRPEEVERVSSWVEAAHEERTALGGKQISETCYQPTILVNPSRSARVSQAEIFGPVVCLYSYSDLDDALTRANDVPFSFQAAVFTSNLDTALKCAHALEAASVMVNDHTAFRVDWMPFAARKESGLGVGGIPYAMNDMAEEKMVVIKSKSL